MAVPFSAVVEVRADGNDSNGGFFDPTVSGAGTDRSQQPSPQHTYTDLAIDGTSANKVTSAARPFTSGPTGDVGNSINVTGGTGFTTGRYVILAVDGGGVATLDANCGTVSSTGGQGRFGGALASLGGAGLLAASNPGVTIWIRGAAGLITTLGGTANVAGGRIIIAAATSGNPERVVRIRGYNTVRGDGGQASLKIHASLTLITLGEGCHVENLAINLDSLGSGVAVMGGSISARVVNVDVTNVANTAFNMSSSGGPGIMLVGCAASGPSGSPGTSVGFNGGNLYNCYASALSVGFRSPSSADTCVAKACGTGFQHQTNPMFASNCLAVDCTGDGYLVISTTNPHKAASLYNCLAVGNGGYGFNTGVLSLTGRIRNCAGYSNTSGNVNTTNLADAAMQLVGFTTLSGDPFADASGGDYTLNNTAGAGAALAGLGFPLVMKGLPDTAHAIDINAVQTPPPTGGGGGGGFGQLLRLGY